MTEIKKTQQTHEKTLLRIGAMCVIVGSVIVFACRGLHGDLPTDTGEAALGHVSHHFNYALVHMGANLGVLFWAIGFFALSNLFTHRVAWAVGRLGAASALVGAAIYIVDFSIDGYALRDLSNAWTVASPSERANLEFATLMVLAALGGVSLSSIIILWGVVLVLFGLAVKMEGYSVWLGWSGLVIGVVTIACGIAQFLQPGFILGLVVYAGLPLVAQLWSLVLGIVIWRRAGSVKAANETQD